jgi:hypothetical protein
LLVSPFDLALIKSENKESVWFYKNTATNQNPHFVLQTKSFLQDEMIDFGSGAYPVFCDINGDSLPDLLVGNYGYYDSATSNGYSIKCHYSASVACFVNRGGSKSNPVFVLVSEDLGGLRKSGYTSLIPSVGDLNGDGRPDVLLGTANGQLIYLENNSSSSANLTFAAPVLNYNSLSLPEYPAVQLFDLDKDGLLDLIVGARSGKISYWKNTGTHTLPSFVLQTDSLGKVNVRDFDNSYFGYATPCFFRTMVGETRLFVASEKGDVAYYKNIDDNLNGAFDLEVGEMFFVSDSNFFPISEGIRTAVSVEDIDNDGYLDMMVGNYAGGIAFYKGIKPPAKKVSVAKSFSEISPVMIFPNPVMNLLYFRVSLTHASVKSVSVYDVVGRCSVNRKMDGQKEGSVDISSFAAGLYVVKFVFEDDTVIMKKFLKE